MGWEGGSRVDLERERLGVRLDNPFKGVAGGNGEREGDVGVEREGGGILDRLAEFEVNDVWNGVKGDFQG